MLHLRGRVRSCLSINRLGVAGAVLQTALFLITLFSHSSFVVIYSKHLQCQTIRPMELKFQETVHLFQHVMCRM